MRPQSQKSPLIHLPGYSTETCLDPPRRNYPARSNALNGPWNERRMYQNARRIRDTHFPSEISPTIGIFACLQSADWHLCTAHPCATSHTCCTSAILHSCICCRASAPSAPLPSKHYRPVIKPVSAPYLSLHFPPFPGLIARFLRPKSTQATEATDARLSSTSYMTSYIFRT